MHGRFDSKGTPLLDSIIDAPVENKPEGHLVEQVKPQVIQIRNFAAADAGQPAITEEGGTSSQSRQKFKRVT